MTRIAKEIFSSGLNNFVVRDIDSNHYSQYFGFTEEEVRQLDPDHYEEIKRWYNGYTFGKTTIYNPWSILSYLDEDRKFKAYWLDTGGIRLIQEAMTLDSLPSIHSLLEGNSIKVKINPHIIFDRIKTDSEVFFNLLYTAGYLTSEGPVSGEFEQMSLKIPNQEVVRFFEETVLNWFNTKAQTNHPLIDQFLQDLFISLSEGETEEIEKMLNILILETLGLHDVGRKSSEAFYHGFILGLAVILRQRYQIKSNRESGWGRYDIALYPKDPIEDPGIVIEVKIGNSSPEKAIAQMQEKAYYTDLIQYGCQKFHLYGLYFDGKSVQVSKA